MIYKRRLGVLVIGFFLSQVCISGEISNYFLLHFDKLKNMGFHICIKNIWGYRGSEAG